MIILDIKGWLYFRLDLSPYLMFVNPVSGKLSPTVFTWDQIWERESLVLFHSVVIWASDFRWNFVDLLCELGGGLVNSCWEGRRSLGHKFRISNVYKILKCPTGSWHGMTRFPTDFEDWYGVYSQVPHDIFSWKRCLGLTIWDSYSKTLTRHQLLQVYCPQVFPFYCLRSPFLLLRAF